MDRGGLLIGEVAARSGLSRKALRLYEARGILPPPHRTPSGYRRYPADVLGLLTFVGRARRLGLTLAEIRHIVGLRRAGSAPCVHVRALLEARAADLASTLAGVRRILDSWRSTAGRHAAVCPHIEASGDDPPGKGSRPARRRRAAPRAAAAPRGRAQAAGRRDKLPATRRWDAGGARGQSGSAGRHLPTKARRRR